MNYGLEQVDQVIARTGASYQAAKDALNHTEGDVLEAIIFIENGGQTQGFSSDKEPNLGQNPNHFGNFGQDVTNFLKDMLRQGNVTRISVAKDDKQILDLPMTAGAIGALFFAPATIISIIAALATGCELSIVKEDGEVINVKDVTKDTLDQVREKVNQTTEKAEDYMDEASENIDEFVENIGERFEEQTKTAEDLYEEVKEDVQEKVEDVKDEFNQDTKF